MSQKRGNLSTLIKAGPAGIVSDSFTAWDETRKITHIFISHSFTNGYFPVGYITSLQFRYEDGGIRGNSPLHGKPGSPAPIFTTVTLDGPSEYITGLKGSFYQYSILIEKEEWISSLTIETNKNKYGPFGSSNNSSDESEFYFQFGPRNQFGGFHGAFGNPDGLTTRLTSIGIYVKPT